MRAILIVGVMGLAGPALAQSSAWTCVARDMRLCHADSKCTKSETAQTFKISSSGANGAVEFCPSKAQCRDFGQVTFEQDGDDTLIKGISSGFTAIIGAKLTFQASGRLRSGGKLFTYAAAGKCEIAALSPPSTAADIMRNTDIVLRDGRAAQFRKRFEKSFPGDKIFCDKPDASQNCRAFAVFPSGSGIGRADVVFGYPEAIAGTKIVLGTGYVTTLSQASWTAIRDGLEKLAAAADDRITIPTLYTPGCQERRDENFGASTIREEPTSDGRCQITIQTE